MLLCLSIKIQSLLLMQPMLLTLPQLNLPGSGNRLPALELDTYSTLIQHSNHWILVETSPSRLATRSSTIPSSKLHHSSRLQPSQELSSLIPVQALQQPTSLINLMLLSHLFCTHFLLFNRLSVQSTIRLDSKVSSTQLSMDSVTRLVMVWLQLFHWPKLSIFTNSTGTFRLTTWINYKTALWVKFGSHQTLLSMTQETLLATSHGWTMSVSNTCQLLTILIQLPIIKHSTVVQLILTRHLIVSMTLMPTLNILTFMISKKIANSVQIGIQLTSLSLSTEPTLPTPQLLSPQFMLQDVKVED